MEIIKNLETLLQHFDSEKVKLVAVSKTHPPEAIKTLYDHGWRRFGENKVQELSTKQAQLPADIEWHLIGSLQTNKVKYIVPFVSLIHSVDRRKLLEEIQKQAARIDRPVDCLLQIHIAQEETKSGFDYAEAEALLLDGPAMASLTHCRIVGLMGMATFTNDTAQIQAEFQGLKAFFDRMQGQSLPPNVNLRELSMGMSGDYALAIAEGSTMIRVGSAIFGARQYH